jgi:FlaG/FlaF family flagellin (archaellin)
MNRWTVLLVAIMCTLFAAMGCSGGGGSPVAPTADQSITDQVMNTGQAETQTHLWGFYEVYMDLENMTVEAVPVRGAMWSSLSMATPATCSSPSTAPLPERAG